MLKDTRTEQNSKHTRKLFSQSETLVFLRASTLDVCECVCTAHTRYHTAVADVYSAHATHRESILLGSAADLFP